MKKLLSILLTLMLVFVVSASVVLADEEAATDTTLVPASSAMPTEEDFKTQKLIYIFEKGAANDKNYGDDIVNIDICITGNDVLMNYMLEQSEINKTPYEEITFDGKRTLVVKSIKFTVDELIPQVNVGYYREDGFFADTEYWYSPMGTFAGNGEDGEVIATYVYKNGNNITKCDIVVGKQNAFASITIINWVNVLIAVMILVVIILAIIIIFLSLKSKKKANEQKFLKEEKFVSEDEVFEKLVDEAGIDIDEDGEEIDDEDVEVEEEADDEDAEADDETDDEEK